MYLIKIRLTAGFVSLNFEKNCRIVTVYFPGMARCRVQDSDPLDSLEGWPVSV